MPKVWILVLLAYFATSPLSAGEAARKHVPYAQPVGTGRLSVLFWDVYDATLYAPHGAWKAVPPYALQIDYFRDIEGDDIAERSVDEMRKQGFSNEVKLAEWQTKMAKIFPDVKKGSQLTAVLTKHKSTDFFDGDRAIGSMNDPEFSARFFAIWLSDKTSEPELRRQLLGTL